MKRRSALKNLSVAFGGLLSLPAWASGWSPESVQHSSLLNVDEDALLAEIVETIIPETDTPGAKSLKVHQFASRMIKDCYDAEAQSNFNKGLVLINEWSEKAYQKSFAGLTPAQKKEIFVNMSNSADPAAKKFATMIKRLTIQGYTNSEYYMVNHLKFNMAPGFYHGCVPVQ